VRLRDPRTLHALALYALPVLVAALGWARGRARRGAGVRAGRDGDPAGCDARAARSRTAPAPAQHFVLPLHEKVRWCLDRLGVPYDEVPDVGSSACWSPAAPCRCSRCRRASRASATRRASCRYLWGEYAGRLPFERTAFLEPTPATLELEQFFDRQLGNDVRVWCTRACSSGVSSCCARGHRGDAHPRLATDAAQADCAGAALRRAADARRVAGARREGPAAHARDLRPGRRHAGRRSTLT